MIFRASSMCQGSPEPIIFDCGSVNLLKLVQGKTSSLLDKFVSCQIKISGPQNDVRNGTHRIPIDNPKKWEHLANKLLWVCRPEAL